MTTSELCILAIVCFYICLSPIAKLEKDNEIIQSICPHTIYLSFLRECIKKTIQGIDFIITQNTFTKCYFPCSFIQVHCKCVQVFWRIILSISVFTIGKIHNIFCFQREEIVFCSMTYKRILTLIQRKKKHKSKEKIIKRNVSTGLLGMRIDKMWMSMIGLILCLQGIEQLI